MARSELRQSWVAATRRPQSSFPDVAPCDANRGCCSVSCRLASEGPAGPCWGQGTLWPERTNPASSRTVPPSPAPVSRSHRVLRLPSMRANAILLGAGLAFAGVVPAGAQVSAGADATGVIGWFSANQSELSDYDDWYHRSAYGGAILGWYWTDHLKTEVELGATSPGELYAVQTIDVAGQRAYGSSEHRFSTRRFTAGQQYQFFRNAWVHPHVAAGADLTWETHQQRDDPIVLYDQASRTSRLVRQARTIGPSTDLSVRPFAEIGTKLYLSRRGFFRTDLRLTFSDGIDEVLLRLGLGVDF